MNLIEQWIEFNEEDPVKVMNTLQENGIVSDNCVTAGDVFSGDAEAAVEFLEVPR